jgi:uncharacterized damage-inducible protein DinB
MATEHDFAKSVAFGDVERELKVTRDVLSALPADKLDWKAHPKSMSLGQLASHVADMPEWMRASLAADELDAANAPRSPAAPFSRDEIIERFEHYAHGLRAAIVSFDMARWELPWTMRRGEQIFTTKERPMVYRVWSMNHLIHHRGQLCVYLRLLDLPVPTVYFNTADEPGMKFE